MGFFSRLFGKKDDEPTSQPSAPASSVAPAEEEDDWEGGDAVPQELAEPEVRQLYNSDHRPVFLDVREDHEREASGWIPGSIHIPCTAIEQRLEELDKKAAVIVYCASGGRSMDAGCVLLDNGFRDVSNLNGGFSNWQGEKENA